MWPIDGKWGSPEKCHPADAKRRSAHPSGISLFGGHAHRTDDRSWGILMFTGAPQIVIFCCTSVKLQSKKGTTNIARTPCYDDIQVTSTKYFSKPLSLTYLVFRDVSPNII